MLARLPKLRPIRLHQIARGEIDLALIADVLVDDFGIQAGEEGVEHAGNRSS